MANQQRPSAGPVLSLFRGPGGLDEGFRQAGFATRLALDTDAAAVDTHRENHGPYARVADVTAVTGRQLIRWWSEGSDCPPVGVIGGPPCQGFSAMNAQSTPGDPRNELAFHYARLLSSLNRKWGLDFFVFENVKGLLQKRHRPGFDAALRQFDRSGFNVKWKLLNALDFGLPQNRERVLVIGVNKKLGTEFDFPDGEKHRKVVGDVLRDLPSPNRDFHPNHWGLQPKSPRIAQIEPGDDRRKSFKRLAWDKPSPTVAYGHNEVHIHPQEHRRITVLEAMLLQGFPMEYVFKGTLSAQNRLISEAVPPPLAHAIAEAIHNQLYAERDRAVGRDAV